MVGPFDLSVSMGLAGDWRQDRVLDAVYETMQCAHKAGLQTIMPVFAPDPTRSGEDDPEGTQ